MSQLNLERMRIELLRGGVSPKFVKRSLIELDTHFQDLKDQAMNDGFSEEEADEKAGATIGSENILIKEILNKKELKTWSWRYPKMLYIFGPIITLILSFAILLISLMSIQSVTPVFMPDQGTEVPTIAKVLVEFLIVFNFEFLTPMLAIFTLMMAKSRLIPARWAVVGVVVLIFLGSGWAYAINWPTADLVGMINFSWGYSFLPRPVSGVNDFQNYVRIITTFTLCTLAWWAYRPMGSAPKNSYIQGSSG